MKVTLINKEVDQLELDCSKMKLGDCGIITGRPSGSSVGIGEIVICGYPGKYWFPEDNTWSSGEGYKYRKLRENEQIVFEGD
jgi:hypothetical protein